MASLIPVRRSPRSINRFCNGVTHPGFTTDQTAILLALAHCSGWSADRIAGVIEHVAGTTLSAEQVYNFHWSWIVRRNGDYLSIEDFEVAQCILAGIDVQLVTRGRPLNRTMYPTTVHFAKTWCSKNVDEEPLFPGYTKEARGQIKSYLSKRGLTVYNRLAPLEEDLISDFGPTMIGMIKDILKQWAIDMKYELHQFPGLKPIRQTEHVGLIMKYLTQFQKDYEQKFGETGDILGPLGKIKNNTVSIRSTAYGVKVFIGLLMADRLQTIEEKRRQERIRISFREVSPSLLAEDSKNCPICQDELGQENEEGLKEIAIKLVICCGQIFGAHCLQLWLNEIVGGSSFRRSCPACRFNFPDTFIEKLLSPEEYERRVNHIFSPSDGPILLSPTPSPRIMNAIGAPIALVQAELSGQSEMGVVGDVEMEG